MIRKKKEREREYVSRSVELIRTIIQVRYNLTMRFLFDLVHGDLCSRHFVFQKKKKRLSGCFKCLHLHRYRCIITSLEYSLFVYIRMCTYISVHVRVSHNASTISVPINKTTHTMNVILSYCSLIFPEIFYTRYINKNSSRELAIRVAHVYNGFLFSRTPAI